MPNSAAANQMDFTHPIDFKSFLMILPRRSEFFPASRELWADRRLVFHALLGHSEAMQQRGPITQDLVLVGGGHAHVHVLKSFGMRPVPGVRLTLISRDVETPYSGMLPGYVAGHYTFEECHIDFGRLTRFAGARLIRDEATGLDRRGHFVHYRAHPPIRWDLLSIDIDSAPRRDDVPGAAEIGFSTRTAPGKPRVYLEPGATQTFPKSTVAP
jgi:hypothetical protein